MSDEQWKEILLADLTTVRVVCRHRTQSGTGTHTCGAVMEIPVGQLASLKNCPLCENPLRPPAEPHEDPFRYFAPALQKIQKVGTVKVSFVLSSGD
jgi:hypothetical protein